MPAHIMVSKRGDDRAEIPDPGGMESDQLNNSSATTGSPAIKIHKDVAALLLARTLKITWATQITATATGAAARTITSSKW